MFVFHRGDGRGFDVGRDVADPVRAESDLLARAGAPVHMMPAVVERRQRPERAAGQDVPGVVGEALAVVPQLREVHRLETEQTATAGDVGDEVVGGAVADRTRCAGRLVDVLVVEDPLHPPRGLVVEVMLPPEAGDLAIVAAAKCPLLRGLRHARRREAVGKKVDRAAARGGGAGVGAGALERVGLELVEREPHREIGRHTVVDELEGHAIVGRHGISAERVDGLGVERAVADIAVAAHVAGESRALEDVTAAADDGKVIEIAEAAALATVPCAIDVAAAPEAEIDRAAGRVIAEHRRGRAAIDVGAAIGMRIHQIRSRKAVRLGDGEAVLQHHDVADAEAVPRIRAADGNADVARAVALLEGDARALLQQVLDGEGGLVLDALAAHGGDGLTRRLRQRARHALRLECRQRRHRRGQHRRCDRSRRPSCAHGRTLWRRRGGSAFEPRRPHQHLGHGLRAGR
jgi:hypothetical protein